MIIQVFPLRLILQNKPVNLCRSHWPYYGYWACRNMVIELVEIWLLSLSKYGYWACGGGHWACRNVTELVEVSLSLRLSLSLSKCWWACGGQWACRTVIELVEMSNHRNAMHWACRSVEILLHKIVVSQCLFRYPAVFDKSTILCWVHHRACRRALLSGWLFSVNVNPALHASQSCIRLALADSVDIFTADVSPGGLYVACGWNGMNKDVDIRTA